MLAELEAGAPPSASEHFVRFERHFARWHGAGGRMRVIPGPIGPQWCSDALLQRAAAIARERELGVHTHALESRLHAIELAATAMLLFTGEHEDLSYAIRPTYWPGIDLVCAAPLLFGAEFGQQHRSVRRRDERADVEHPETGKPITASIGRYGPYLAHDGKYARLVTGRARLAEK